MKKIIIIFIVIGMLGGIYIYTRTAEDNNEEGAYFVSTVFISSTFETCIFKCTEDLVTKATNISQDEPSIDIEQEISEYRERFIELYTSNALDDTEYQMNIEEFEIDYDGNNGEPTTLIKYTDSYGEVLRYQLHFYGETMHCSIDYYLCEDFVLVSKECNYYSSWVLTAGYSDVLYSSIENWIIFEDTVYILHDDGELEEIEEMQMEIPLIEEIEAYRLY